MGEPDNPKDSTRFEVDDLTVYVSREILDALTAGQSKLLIAVAGYGRFWLHLEIASPTPSRRD